MCPSMSPKKTSYDVAKLSTRYMYYLSETRKLYHLYHSQCNYLLSFYVGVHYPSVTKPQHWHPQGSNPLLDNVKVKVSCIITNINRLQIQLEIWIKSFQ
jgi:hypothetical protein